MHLLVGRPLLVELFREVAFAAENSRLHGVWVERELDAKLGVEVDEGVNWFFSNSVLTPNFRDHSNASIRQFDVLLVQLIVFLEGCLDVLVVQDLAINDRAQILEHHVDLTNGRRLDEVLHYLLLHVAHLA